MNATCIAATVDADFNIFGYDPDGRIAHLVSHFYGPDWRPKTFGHISVRLRGDAQAPRYSYPAPHQVPFLPTEFQPSPPPQYYGRPYSPYLPPPKIFDPNIFAALLPLPRGILAVGMPSLNSQSHINDFDIRPSRDGVLGDSPIACTTGQSVLHSEGDDLEKRTIWFQRLSSDPLVLETYALDYPSIEELLTLLGVEYRGTEGFLTMEQHNEMRLAGMDYVDDLAMISEKALYLSSSISPEKIQAIFLRGREMINVVHEKHKIEILDLKRMREEWERRRAQVQESSDSGSE